MKTRPLAALTLLLHTLPLVCVVACSDGERVTGATDAGRDSGRDAGGSDAGTARCAAYDPDKVALFGDLHVHTAYSFDAYIFGTKLDPDDAYAVAKGGPRTVYGGATAQLSRPLDFAATTDHSEFLGEVSLCTDPSSAVYATPDCASYRAAVPSGTASAGFVRFALALAVPDPQRIAQVCGQDGGACLNAATTAWQKEQEATAQADDPTSACTFTSLYAYEWTASPGGSHHHRNVIFRNAHVPTNPVTYFDEQTPETLWAELAARCNDAGTGCDFLAIPHNSDLSNGWQFQLEASLTAEEAATRAQFEPLVEIYQNKGYSECKPGVDTADPLCAFEQIQAPICAGTDGGTDAGTDAGGEARADAGACLPVCPDDTGNTTNCEHRLNFVRNALKQGLVWEQQIGQNPFKVGLIASTDTHNGTPGATEEYSWRGHQGVNDSDPQDRITNTGLGAGGLAGVWAEENSRESIFLALRRRETFATTGTRLRVRFFGGWSLPTNLCSATDWVHQAYALGVPMGADLPGAPAMGGGAPSFLAWAAKDPGTAAHPGTPLQRIQVVKGWVDPSTGTASEHVYDVTGNSNNDASVDPTTCVQSGAGSDQLCAVWSDPDFVAGQRAFYYVRALENPSCRHAAYDCASLDAGARPPECSETSELTQQERAWSSPIWYHP
jgi:hypothetical protein